MIIGAHASAQADEEFKYWQQHREFNHSPAARWTRMADQHLQYGDIETALPLYEKALSLDKNFAPAYHNRAQCYIGLSRNQEALQDLNRCVALPSSQQYLALCSLAQLHYSMGQYPAAIATWNKLLAIGRNNSALFDRAQCYETMGKFNLAIADLTEVLKYSRTKANILCRRARVYSRMHQFDKVIADCSAVIKADPAGTNSKDANIEVLKLRADAYKKLGQDALAKRDLARLQQTYKSDDALAPFSTK